MSSSACTAFAAAAHRDMQRKPCPHGCTRRHACRACSPQSFCIHNRQRARCRQCQGQYICAHAVRRDTCMQCNPRGFCAHRRRPDLCLACTPHNFCMHGVLRLCARCAELRRSGTPPSPEMVQEAAEHRAARLARVWGMQPSVNRWVFAQQCAKTHEATQELLAAASALTSLAAEPPGTLRAISY